MKNFNEIFGKEVTYDNIKSHKKVGSHPHFRRQISGKTTRVGSGVPPAFLGLMHKVNLTDVHISNLRKGSQHNPSNNNNPKMLRMLQLKW